MVVERNISKSRKTPTSVARATSEVRRVSDAKTLRALTHPVRIALIESLSISGPGTATEVGERIGETPTTCSFHLRQLAKYGFVEEAGGGKGRARPWKMTSIGFSLAAGDDDPEAQLASSAALRLIREQQLERYANWRQTKSNWSKQWRDASEDSEYSAYLTPDELRSANEAIHAILMPLVRERMEDPSKRPEGSKPVEFLLLSYPLSLDEARR